MNPLPKTSSALLSAVLMLLPLRVSAEQVTVRVLGPDDQPVPGAIITYLPPGPGTAQEGDKPDDTAARTVKTSETGIAPVQITSRGSGEQRQRGRVFAEAPGMAPNMAWIAPGTDAPAEAVLRLETARPLSGQLQDPGGKPVAGVKVAVRFVLLKQSRFIMFEGTPLEKRFITLTDAAGNWKLDDLPDRGHARIAIDDARYFVLSQPVDLARTEPILLVARPAAMLTGRVLEDGVPAIGVKVGAHARINEEAIDRTALSDAEGRYTIGGLRTGSYTVGAVAPPARGRVPAMLESLVAVEGETKPVPDLVLLRGAIVEGTMRDAVTQAPIAGVRIGARSPVIAYPVESDAAGRFQLRVPPGKVTLFVQGADDYLPRDREQKIEVVDGDTATVQFALSSGATIQGIVRDEVGKPVAKQRIQATVAGLSKDAVTDPAGRFKIRGLTPGNVIFSATGRQIISPAQVRAPATDIVLKLGTRKVTTLRGRVVDARGAPVAGAAVTARVFTPDGEQEFKHQTSADGHYELAEFPADFLASGSRPGIEIEKAGWRVRTTPRITRPSEIVGVNGRLMPNPGGAYKVSDAVLEKLGRTIRGLVTDAAGKPVEGARVAALTTATRTDASGRFTFSNLPESVDRVIAASATAFGVAPLQKSGAGAAPGGEEVSVVLAPQQYSTRDVPGGTRVLTELARRTEGTQFGGRAALPADLATADVAAAVQLHKLVAGANKRPPYELAAALDVVATDAGRSEAERDAAKAALTELVQSAKPVDGIWALMLAFHAVPSDEQWAREVWDAAQARFKPLGAGADWPTLAERVNALRLGLRLQHPDAPGLLDELLKVAAPQEARLKDDSYLRAIAEGIAQAGSTPAGVDALGRVLAMTPAKSRGTTLETAVTTLAPLNPPAALDLLRKFGQVLTATAAGNERVDGARANEITLGRSATAIIREFTRENNKAPAALTLARQVKSGGHAALALAYAARGVPPAEAPALWREAFDSASAQEWPGGDRGFIVALALRHNRPVGEQLAGQLESAIPANPRYSGWARERASLALALAPFQPGHARWLLEQSWSSRFEEGMFPDGEDETVMAVAMSVLDPERALEWAEQIGQPNSLAMPNPFHQDGQNLKAERAVAQFLLADEQGRMAVPLHWWTRGVRRRHGF